MYGLKILSDAFDLLLTLADLFGTIPFVKRGGRGFKKRLDSAEF